MQSPAISSKTGEITGLCSSSGNWVSQQTDKHFHRLSNSGATGSQETMFGYKKKATEQRVWKEYVWWNLWQQLYTDGVFLVCINSKQQEQKTNTVNCSRLENREASDTKSYIKKREMGTKAAPSIEKSISCARSLLSKSSVCVRGCQPEPHKYILFALFCYYIKQPT